MMSNKKFFFGLLSVLLLALTILTVNGATLRCRTGKVLAAESTLNSINVAGLDELAQSKIPEVPAYVAIVIQPDKDRSLGLQDYCFKLGSLELLPIAWREDDGNFTAEAIEEVNPEKRYTLLFCLDASATQGPGNWFTGTLKNRLSETGLVNTELNVPRPGKNEFTAPTTIPAEGILYIKGAK